MYSDEHGKPIDSFKRVEGQYHPDKGYVCLCFRYDGRRLRVHNFERRAGELEILIDMPKMIDEANAVSKEHINGHKRTLQLQLSEDTASALITALTNFFEAKKSINHD